MRIITLRGERRVARQAAEDEKLWRAALEDPRIMADISRAAPAMNILAVAFPIQIGLGLLALFASIPLIATFFTGWDVVYDGVVSHVLFALAGGGR